MEFFLVFVFVALYIAFEYMVFGSFFGFKRIAKKCTRCGERFHVSVWVRHYIIHGDNYFDGEKLICGRCTDSDEMRRLREMFKNYSDEKLLEMHGTPQRFPDVKVAAINEEVARRGLKRDDAEYQPPL